MTFVILLTDIYAILSTYGAICAVEKGSCSLLSVVLAYIPTYLLKKTRLKECILLFQVQRLTLIEQENLFYRLEPSLINFCLLLVLDRASLQTLLFWRQLSLLIIIQRFRQLSYNLLKKCSDSTQFSSGGIKTLYS